MPGSSRSRSSRWSRFLPTRSKAAGIGFCLRSSDRRDRIAAALRQTPTKLLVSRPVSFLQLWPKGNGGEEKPRRCRGSIDLVIGP